jgi:hypothetical protein
MQDECRKYEKSQFVECVVFIMRESGASSSTMAFAEEERRQREEWQQQQELLRSGERILRGLGR